MAYRAGYKRKDGTYVRGHRVRRRRPPKKTNFFNRIIKLLKFTK